ncbi:MAG: hypothetical protein MJE77_24245, partial [Proteobacteria bacterium]|nr:hypothetical protein [Pseudomonadota bacterium]
MELEKLQQMLDDRLRALQTSAQNGSIDPESVRILQAEIDVIEANVAKFRGVVEEMDVAPGTGSVGRPDAPPGYPDPPEGHYYYRQGDGWDVKRYPESDAPAKMLLSDGQGGFRIVVREGAEPPAARFPEGMSKEQAFEQLAGPDARSSFKAYFEMLSSQDPPIATRDDILAAMREPGGQTVDLVRHELKQHFRDAVLRRMLYAADGAPLDDATSWARLREMTAGLNSSDKGNLTEAWYLARHAEGGARHVRIPGSTFGSDMDRFADVVHNGAIREIKSGEGVLSSREIEQFNFYMGMINREPKPILEGQTIEEVVYVFTSPQGARANLNWMLKALGDHQYLGFEVFNSRGVRRIFREEDVDALRSFLQ